MPIHSVFCQGRFWNRQWHYLIVTVKDSSTIAIIDVPHPWHSILYLCASSVIKSFDIIISILHSSRCCAYMSSLFWCCVFTLDGMQTFSLIMRWVCWVEGYTWQVETGLGWDSCLSFVLPSYTLVGAPWTPSSKKWGDALLYEEAKFAETATGQQGSPEQPAQVWIAGQDRAIIKVVSWLASFKSLVARSK